MSKALGCKPADMGVIRRLLLATPEMARSMSLGHWSFAQRASGYECEYEADNQGRGGQPIHGHYTAAGVKRSQSRDPVIIPLFGIANAFSQRFRGPQNRA